MTEHFLITRFNVRLASWSSNEAVRRLRATEWQDGRIDLFERYCLPSVMHQIERRFRWLLLLDEESDEVLRRRLRVWQDRLTNIEPVFLPLAGDEDIAAAVRVRLNPRAKLLLTTRLDSDDALHESALAEIRSRARDRREFLNIRLGFKSNGRTARVVSHKYNPFTTLAEPTTGTLHTVHCGLPHGQVRRLAPVRQIVSQPLWLVIVHGSNTLRGTAERRNTTVLRGLHQKVKRAGRRIRESFWPDEYRRGYTLEEIAPSFHIGEYTRTSPET